MKILNMNSGFSTNSSSSHSVVFVPEYTRNKVVNADFMRDFEGYKWCGYGWEDFILCSPEDKRKYFAIMLYENLADGVGKECAKQIANNTCGVELTYIYDDGDYIDHNSIVTLPKTRTGNVDIEFAKALLDNVLLDGIVILGGNDNSGDTYSKLRDFGVFCDNYTIFNWINKHGDITSICRHEYDNIWTIFNWISGDRVTVDMSKSTIENYFREDNNFVPKVPFIADIKITNMCNMNCPYCYQDSVADGAHADISDIQDVIQELASIGIFEVAIGGGEPTLHPNFIEILQEFSSAKIKPNFSTRQTDWMSDKYIATLVYNTCGAIGFTPTYKNSVRIAAESIKKSVGYIGKKLHIQIVEGAQDNETLEQWVRDAVFYKLPITLLGFKSIGRGSSFITNEKIDFLKDVVKMSDCRVPVSIDTQLARENEEFLSNAGVPRYRYSTQEVHGIYVDCVDSMVAPYSFIDKDKMVPFSAYELGKEIMKICEQRTYIDA